MLPHQGREDSIIWGMSAERIIPQYLKKLSLPPALRMIGPGDDGKFHRGLFGTEGGP